MMRRDLLQILFLSIFWFICTVVVFFVPWWSDSNSSEEETSDVIESWQNLGENNSVTDSNLYSWEQINIAISETINSTNMQKFINDFSKKYWWKVNLYIIKPPYSWLNFQDINIVIIPYEFLSWIDLQDINFQEDISELFILQLRKLVKENKNILPFSIDIPVFYWLTWLSDWLDWLHYRSQKWEPSRALSSFSFGIYDTWALFDQNLILSQQLLDFLTYNDVWSFSRRISYNSLTKENQKKLLEVGTSLWKECEKNPIYCLVKKKLIGIWRWFSSSIPDDSEISKYKYPYEYIGDLVRLYVLWITNLWDNSNFIYQFLLDYMDRAFSEQENSIIDSFWMLPVFQNEYDKKCSLNGCWLGSNLNIMWNNVEKLHNFLEDWMLKRIIEKKIQPDLYFKYTSL